MLRESGTMFGASLLLLSIFAVSQDEQTSRKQSSSSAGLPAAAHETYVNYNRAYQAGKVTVQREGDEVQLPSNYWADPIMALNPLKVYMHRMNIVVVLQFNGKIEEGKYILLPITSYLPTNGVDGFEYTPNPQRDNKFYAGDEVLDYRRVRSK